MTSVVACYLSSSYLLSLASKVGCLPVFSYTNPVMPDLTKYSYELTYSDAMSNEIMNELLVFVTEQVQRHDTHPAAENMLDSGDAGLLTNIRTQRRWTREHGEICLLRYDGTIVGISCVEHGEIHPRVSVGGIRCWLDASHRSYQLMSKFLLRKNLDWSRERNKLAMLLTFNHYNKWIYDAIARRPMGSSTRLSNVWSEWWNDVIALPAPISIRYTQQWCLLKPTMAGANIHALAGEVVGNA